MLILDHESLLEHDFLTLLDHDPNCVDIQTQPLYMYYEYKKRTYKYCRDVWALFVVEGEPIQRLFEVKYTPDLHKLLEKANERVKNTHTHTECKKYDWTFQFVTDRHIYGTRLTNIKKCLAAAKHYAPLKLTKDLEGVVSHIHKLVTDQRLTIPAIADRIEPFFPHLDRAELIALLKHQIYHSHGFYIDWTVPLEEAIVSTNPIPITPVYLIPPSDGEKSSKTFEDIITQQEHISVAKNEDSRSQKELTENELILIQPLIDAFQSIISEYKVNYTKEPKKEKRKILTGNKNKLIKNTIHNFCDERNLLYNHIQQLYRKWIHQQKTKERKQLVQPVIDRFLTDGKKAEILTFCKAAPPEGLGKSNNVAIRIYKLYLKYKRGSANALRPSPKTHHNESRKRTDR